MVLRVGNVEKLRCMTEFQPAQGRNWGQHCVEVQIGRFLMPWEYSPVFGKRAFIRTILTFKRREAFHLVRSVALCLARLQRPKRCRRLGRIVPGVETRRQSMTRSTIQLAMVCTTGSCTDNRPGALNEDCRPACWRSEMALSSGIDLSQRL